MSTISEKTNELFMASSLSDDDLGYPGEVGRLGTARCLGRRCLPVAAGQFLGESGELVELFAARAVALLAVGE
jgi:hypothetical protein